MSYASKCTAPAHNATSALRITMQCVHQELDIAWRLDASFAVAIVDEKNCLCFRVSFIYSA